MTRTWTLLALALMACSPLSQEELSQFDPLKPAPEGLVPAAPLTTIIPGLETEADLAAPEEPTNAEAAGEAIVAAFEDGEVVTPPEGEATEDAEQDAEELALAMPADDVPPVMQDVTPGAIDVQLLMAVPSSRPPRAVLRLGDGEEVVVTPGTMLPELGLVVELVAADQVRLVQYVTEGARAVPVTRMLTATFPLFQQPLPEQPVPEDKEMDVPNPFMEVPSGQDHAGAAVDPMQPDVGHDTPEPMDAPADPASAEH